MGAGGRGANHELLALVDARSAVEAQEGETVERQELFLLKRGEG